MARMTDLLPITGANVADSDKFILRDVSATPVPGATDGTQYDERTLDVSEAAAKFGILPTGAWSNSTAYTPGKVVTRDGSSYRCKLGHTNQQPPNATYWDLLASKGDTGATGATGAAARELWQGEWSIANTYQPGDVVLYASEGIVYQCLTARNPGNHSEPLSGDTGGWQRLTGLQGDTGPAGTDATHNVGNSPVTVLNDSYGVLTLSPGVHWYEIGGNSSDYFYVGGISGGSVGDIITLTWAPSAGYPAVFNSSYWSWIPYGGWQLWLSAYYDPLNYLSNGPQVPGLRLLRVGSGDADWKPI